MGGSPCQGVIRDGMGRLFIDNEVAVTMFVPGSPPSWTTVIPVSPDEDSFSDITLGPQGQIFAAHDGGNSLVRALPGHGGWLLQTVYQFGVNDGATDPNSLSTGPDGTVYGTARGTSSVGGYLYQKSPSETGITFLTGVPATFGNLLGMTLDTTGNIYGATAKGVFKWWRLGSRPPTMLASFTTAPGGGGYYPPFPPVLGNDGALYGVTTPPNSAGAVYRVTPTGQHTFVHTFAGNEWGSQAALVRGPGGWLYGTGLGGAHGQGFVFRVHT
jgi:hypothetical protein